MISLFNSAPRDLARRFYFVPQVCLQGRPPALLSKQSQNSTLRRHYALSQSKGPRVLVFVYFLGWPPLPHSSQTPPSPPLFRPRPQLLPIPRPRYTRSPTLLFLLL